MPMYRSDIPMYRSDMSMCHSDILMYCSYMPMYRSYMPMYRSDMPMYRSDTSMYRSDTSMYSVERRLAGLFGEVSKLRRAKRKSPDFHIATEYGKQSFPSNCDVGRSHTPNKRVSRYATGNGGILKKKPYIIIKS